MTHKIEQFGIHAHCHKLLQITLPHSICFQATVSPISISYPLKILFYCNEDLSKNNKTCLDFAGHHFAVTAHFISFWFFVNAQLFKLNFTCANLFELYNNKNKNNNNNKNNNSNNDMLIFSPSA